jgi:hypothetical protein
MAVGVLFFVWFLVCFVVWFGWFLWWFLFVFFCFVVVGGGWVQFCFLVAVLGL